MSLYLLYVSVYMCVNRSLSYVSTFHMHSHVKSVCTHMDTLIHVLTVFAHVLQACPSACSEPYLSIRERVVVGPHLWVHVLQVPLEAATL